LEVGFYHLTRSRVEQALPALLLRTLDAGARACVMCPDAALLRSLDLALWERPEWLPHGTVADGDADLQPIWLAQDDAAPNGATFLFLVGGAQSMRLSAFARAFDLFDGGRAEAVQAARERWAQARAAGHALTYWQQTERGWQKQG
jgi:DNA polymerase-3 subunit chi